MGIVHPAGLSAGTEVGPSPPAAGRGSLAAALHDLQQRYEDLFDLAGDAIVVHEVIASAAHGNFVQVNPAACRLLGYTAAEMKELTPLDIMAPEDRATVVGDVKIMRRDGLLRREKTLLAKDGRRIATEITTRQFDQDGRQMAMSVIRDITERKRADRALREVNELLELRVRERTTELQQINERLRAENEERIRTEQSLRLEEARLDALLHLSQIRGAPLDEIASYTLEQAIALTRSKIGFVGLLNEDATVYTLHSVSKDVVKECAVVGDPVQWHVADAGIWADAIRERRTLFVNDYSLPHPRKRGFPPGHPVVQKFMIVPILDGERIVALAGVGNKAQDYDRADERQVALLLSGMWGCVQRNRSREELEEAYARLEEKVVQRTAELAASAAALRELNETLEQRIAERTAEVRDQADRLRALATQLGQAEHRERKRLAKILHDHIQQLIVAARMQLRWLALDREPAQAAAAAQAVDSILLEALHASRNLTVDLSPPVLHEAGLAGALSWLAARIREKHQLAVSLRADNQAEPASEETRFLLFECARELLFNVVKHAGVGRAQVTLARTEDDEVRLIVADEGRGFDLGRVQELPAGEDAFGLFSIQERFAHIGGHMEIETAPGRGTLVSLTVPIGRAAAPAGGVSPPAAGARAAAEVRMHRSKDEPFRVLIADDHQLVREGLVGLLQLEPDIEVVGEAADGLRAVELAATLEPDVVVLDVNLGEMSGVEVTRRIVAANPRIKVIGLSMHDTDVAIAMRDAGAAAYVVKGGPPGELIAAIRACRPRS